MPGNTFGKIFKITTFGESHGKAMGVVVDGCPAGLEISEDEIQKELDKRKPGQSELTTARDEEDKVEILSGIFEGITLGTPIALLVYNKDQRSKDYEDIKDVYRPGSADFTWDAKYVTRDYRGGGRASARETWSRVAGGAIAKKILNKINIEIKTSVIQVGLSTSNFEEEILKAKAEGDSVGGIVEVIIKNTPAGLGEPVFDKLSADLAKAMVSIPAVKGFEIGNGFKVAEMCGSENNDELEIKDSEVKTKTNNSGGIIGGISNGEDIILRIAFKAPSSISKKQKTINKNKQEVEIEIKGRHDPCVCFRALPVVESMAALVIVDHYLLSKINKI